MAQYYSNLSESFPSKTCSLSSRKEVVSHAPFFSVVHSKEDRNGEEECSETVVCLVPFYGVESFCLGVALELSDACCTIGVLELNPVLGCLCVLYCNRRQPVALKGVCLVLCLHVGR
jgi:hypothetical protein